mmetsp:Transcript_12068/g.27886  ORF Transcript_12068/g.27886 Transcript_12068/m.27886 type:complete len:461 (-) Transcript_12068:171-1553(-)
MMGEPMAMMPLCCNCKKHRGWSGYEKNACRHCRPRVQSSQERKRMVEEEGRKRREEEERKRREEGERKRREEEARKFRKEEEEECKRKEQDERELAKIQRIGVIDFKCFKDVVQKASGSVKLVYKATWIHPQHGDRTVALLQIRGSGSRGTREDVLQEVKFFEKLGQHENLLKLYGITVEPTRNDFCLVTEHANEGSLDNTLLAAHDAGVKFSPLVLLEAVMQICRGMVHLSLHDILHRDLATRNVLVFRWDPRDHQTGIRLKIADYGLALMMHGENGNPQGSAMTTSGSTVRPIRWMAPESISRRQYSEKSDVWAFGVTMWEIWTYGEVPYGAIASDEDVGRKVVDGERLPSPPQCPPGIYSIMKKCWSRDKTQRPSFDDLKGLLRQQYDDCIIEMHAGEREDEQPEVQPDCVICLEQAAHWAFIPCGHRCICEECKNRERLDKCPVCRAKHTNVIRIY